MPADATSYSSGAVTFTTGLPINNVTAILLYCFTDGNGGGNSTGNDQCTISQFQGMGPYQYYNDIGLYIKKGGSVQKIGVSPITANNSTSNLRVYKNGTTYGIPLLATNNPGAGNVCISKGGTTYSLPNAAYTPTTNLSTLPGSSYAWSGGFGSVYSSGFNYGWSYSGGGTNGGGYLYSYFPKATTLSQIQFNLSLYAYGYGDHWHTYYVQYDLYYSTQPVGQTPSWINLYEYSQGSH